MGKGGLGVPDPAIAYGASARRSNPIDVWKLPATLYAEERTYLRTAATVLLSGVTHGVRPGEQVRKQGPSERSCRAIGLGGESQRRPSGGAGRGEGAGTSVCLPEADASSKPQHAADSHRGKAWRS